MARSYGPGPAGPPDDHSSASAPEGASIPFMARLVVTAGTGSGTSHELARALILGRQKGVDVLVDDIAASREHCKVYLQGSDFWIIDLNSRNGTKVNGAPVTRRQLWDGDVITIGNAAVRFEAPEAPPPARSAPAAAAPAAAPSTPPATAAPSRGPSVMEQERQRLRDASTSRDRPSQGARPAADDGSGVVIKQEVLQFSRVENRDGLVHEDIGQRGGLFKLLVALGAVAFVAGLAWGIVHLMTGGPPTDEEGDAAEEIAEPGDAAPR